MSNSLCDVLRSYIFGVVVAHWIAFHSSATINSFGELTSGRICTKDRPAVSVDLINNPTSLGLPPLWK